MKRSRSREAHARPFVHFRRLDGDRRARDLGPAGDDGTGLQLQDQGVDHQGRPADRDEPAGEARLAGALLRHEQGQGAAQVHRRQPGTEERHRSRQDGQGRRLLRAARPVRLPGGRQGPRLLRRQLSSRLAIVPGAAFWALLAAAWAAARDWPQPNGDVRGTRAVDATGISSQTVAGLQVRWRFRLPAGSDFGSIASTPVVLGNTVYLQTLGSSVYALDLSTGRIR